MRTIALVLLLISSAFLTGGCTSSAMQRSTTQAALEPTADTAVVIFMRTALLGGGIQSVVYDTTTSENKFIGIVSQGMKVCYRTTPGEHMFMVASEAADFMKATLDANKTYYVKVEPRMGAWRARFSLDPIRGEDLTEDRIASLKTSCTLYDNTPRSQAWATNNAASVQAKRVEYFAKWISKAQKDRDEATLLASDGR